MAIRAARLASTLFALFAVLASLPASALAAAPPLPHVAPAAGGPCHFVLGFATLAGMIPQQVGQCQDDETHNPLNGDALQHTTTSGLLVWRKSDNWTAFTDGYHTWINGPKGLQQRLNIERFPWELRGAAALVAGQGSSLYVSGWRGYDVSYPQCPNSAPPPGNFGIAGAGGGRPFSTNACAGAQFGWVSGASNVPALYMNTGYLDSYKSHITPECAQMAGGNGQPWPVGCSEAAFAVDHQPGQPWVWWLDVETSNSWAGDPAVNRQVIQGAVSYLQQKTPAAIGIYANPTQWSKITGGNNWGPAGLQATWVVPSHVNGGDAPRFCGGEFMGVPVWLVQYPGDHVDANYAC